MWPSSEPGSDQKVFSHGVMLRAVVVAVAASAGLGCGEEPVVPTPTPATVRIASSVARLHYADTARLTATVNDSQGRQVAASVAWSSSAPAVVTVSTTGLAIAKGGGTAMLHARIGSLADSLAVTVAERYIQVAAGHQFACGLTDLGKTYCWGGSGALGSQKDSSAVPLLVETSARFTSIYASRSYACGLTGEGQAWCWGGCG